eukprot:15439261-Alexandrium_andersonii.AAC.1
MCIRDSSNKQSDLAKALADSEILKLTGTLQDPIAICYGPKQVGEATSQPTVRDPPFSEPHYMHCMNAFMDARPVHDEITEGDCFVLFDAGKPGH